MANMYELMRNVVLAKKQSTAELKRRIDTFWAQGSLTDAEKAELERMVFENQTIEAEKGELDEMYRVLTEKYNALEARVTALEGGEGPEVGYPVWKPWDGVSTDYRYGAVVSHNGTLWRNVLEGMQNVWEPGAADSRYWVEVQQTDAAYDESGEVVE